MKVSFLPYDNNEIYRIYAINPESQGLVVEISTKDVFDIEMVRCNGEECDFNITKGTSFRGRDLAKHRIIQLPRDLISAVVKR